MRRQGPAAPTTRSRSAPERLLPPASTTHASVEGDAADVPDGRPADSRATAPAPAPRRPHPHATGCPRQALPTRPAGPDEGHRRRGSCGPACGDRPTPRPRRSGRWSGRGPPRTRARAAAASRQTRSISSRPMTRFVARIVQPRASSQRLATVSASRPTRPRCVRGSGATAHPGTIASTPSPRLMRVVSSVPSASSMAVSSMPAASMPATSAIPARPGP